MPSGNQAIPLCVPDNCSWDESTQRYTKQSNEKRESLKVIDAARRQLRAIKGPVCVVTIAGPCRKGKSYILSKAFDQEQVFPLGHLLDPETMGIWMWVVPQKFTDKNGREFTVVLLDSEGIDAVTAESRDDNKIFTLSVLLGSVLIYNSSGVPTRTDLEGLEFVSKLTQRIHLQATKSKTGHKGSRPTFSTTFPYFVWLLRDVLLTLPPDCKTIKDYFLQRVFNSALDSNVKAGNVAEKILDLFKGFDAFQLPPPSFDDDVIQNLNDDHVQGQLNPKFLSGVQKFKEFLRDKLTPKTSLNDGEFVTGEALAALVDIYVETLNTPGAVPCVEKAWEVFIDRKCSEATGAALKKYEQMMALVEQDLPCSNDEIHQFHRAAWDEGLNVFKCETEGVCAVNTDKYLKGLAVETTKLHKQWLEGNKRLTKDACEQLIGQLKQRIIDPILAQLTSNQASSLTFKDIVRAYDLIESEYKKLARGAEDVCASVFANFQPQLKNEMQNHMQYLKKLKDYDEKIAEEREVRAREEEERKELQERMKSLEEEKLQAEKEFEIINARRAEDELRMKEQYQLKLQAQREQFENFTAANMEELRRQREDMAAQKDNTSAMIQMMGEMIKSRDKEMSQLTKSMLELANRPPVVIEKNGDCVIS